MKLHKNSAFVLGMILTDSEWRIIPIIWLVVAVFAIILCKVYQIKSVIIVKEDAISGKQSTKQLANN